MWSARLKVAAVVVGMGLMGGVMAGEEGATRPAAAREGKAPFTISRETTAITGPLRADGTVDYVAALNEKYGKGVTAENNGFVVWLKVVGQKTIAEKNRAKTLEVLGVKEQSEGGEFFFVGFEEYLKQAKGMDEAKARQVAGEIDQAWKGMWKAERYPELAEYLTHEEKFLKLAEEAVGRPRWWSPYVGDSVIEALLPGLRPVREISMAWCARATLRAGAGDFAGFLADVLAARRLAWRVGGGATLIERLVGIAVDAHACRTIGVAAGSGELSVEECAKLAGAMREFRATPTVWEGVDVCERWVQLDFLRMVATGAGADLAVGELLGRFKEVDRASVNWDIVLKRVNKELDQGLAGMKSPTMEALREADAAAERRRGQLAAASSERSIAKEKGESRETYSDRVADLAIAVLMPSVFKTEELSRRGVILQQVMRVVLAAAEFRAKNGKWPATMGAMVPEFLKEPVKDIYSKDGAEAVRYVVTEKGVRVYSVGPNGVDDGGVNDSATKRDDIGVGVE